MSMNRQLSVEGGTSGKLLKNCDHLTCERAGSFTSENFGRLAAVDFLVGEDEEGGWLDSNRCKEKMTAVKKNAAEAAATAKMLMNVD